MRDWQTGVPPVTGWYDVIWDPSDRVPDTIYVHAFVRGDEPCASWGDTPTDDAEAWGDEERTATWKLRSPAAMPGLSLPADAIGWRYVYRGESTTKPASRARS